MQNVYFSMALSLGVTVLLSLPALLQGEEDCQEEFLATSLIQRSVTRQLSPEASRERHHWSSRGGSPAMTSAVTFSVPDISQSPSWVWANDFNEQVRHSPLIDADRNIYLATTTRLRKLTQSGDLLWTVQFDDGKLTSSPTLCNGSVYTMTTARQGPTVASIDMKNGNVIWKKTFLGLKHSGDAESLNVVDGHMFFGINRGGQDGTDTVVAASASDGAYLWEYQTDEITWNFSPAFPNDGSLLFASSCGAVFRLSFNGSLLWRAGKGKPQGTEEHLCVPGGGTLGPNGVFYTETSQNSDMRSEDGTLAAWNVTDGSLLWERSLPLRAAQYPSVGRLGKDGPLAVVAGLGDNPMLAVSKVWDMVQIALQGPLRNSVLAVDATTGATLWQYDAPPYYSTVAAGDYDSHNVTDGSVCWPDAQGIPLITGDGTVFASSSLDGALRAIKDADGDGIIAPSEVTSFETHNGFLNSPSAAPGMLVVAPCWGPVYAWNGSRPDSGISTSSNR